MDLYTYKYIYNVWVSKITTFKTMSWYKRTVYLHCSKHSENAGALHGHTLSGVKNVRNSIADRNLSGSLPCDSLGNFHSKSLDWGFETEKEEQ